MAAKPARTDTAPPRNATSEDIRSWEELKQTSLRVFQYPRWDGFDIGRYRKQVLEKFKADLDKHLNEEVRPKQASMQPTLAIKPEPFEALALHVCRRMSAEAIAESNLIQAYRKHSSVISKDLAAAAAKLIGFGKLPSPQRRARWLRR